MASFTACDTLRLQFQDSALRQMVSAVDAVRSPACGAKLGWRDEAVRQRPSSSLQHPARHYRRVSRHLPA